MGTKTVSTLLAQLSKLLVGTLRVRVCEPGVIALCCIMGLTTAAHAQPPLAGNLVSQAGAVANGWWSPQPRAFTVLSPHNQLSNPRRTDLDESREVLTLEPINRYPAGGIDARAMNSAGLEFSAALQNLAFSSLREPAIFPRFLLSYFQARYAAWESSLEYSEPPTNMNGVLVYPLFQARYATWQLPVNLAVPPLRGSDGRR